MRFLYRQLQFSACGKNTVDRGGIFTASMRTFDAGVIRLRITEQLLELARIWSAIDGRSLARLATMVVDRGSFFDLIQRPGSSCTIATFEKFLSFFRDGANWPDGQIPEKACDLLENFSNIALPAPASPGAAEDCAGVEAQTPLPDGELPPRSSIPGRAGEAGAEEPARPSAPAERAGQDAGDLAA